MKYRSETNNPKPALRLVSSRLLLALVVSVSSYFGVVELAKAEGKDTLYRYRDEKGRVVMANQIPPEYVKFGYSILNRHGQVIKEVPRAPTEEELRAMKAAGTVKAEVEAQKRRQQAEDAQLLRTFSSAEDAERAMERKLAALDVIIDITKGNISRLNTRIALAEEKFLAWQAG